MRVCSSPLHLPPSLDAPLSYIQDVIESRQFETQLCKEDTGGVLKESLVLHLHRHKESETSQMILRGC